MTEVLTFASRWMVIIFCPSHFLLSVCIYVGMHVGTDVHTCTTVCTCVLESVGQRLILGFFEHVYVGMLYVCMHMYVG